MEWLCFLSIVLLGADAIIFEILYFRERARRKEAEALYLFEGEHSEAVAWRLRKHIIELEADRARLERELNEIIGEIDASAEEKYQEFKKGLEEQDGDV